MPTDTQASVGVCAVGELWPRLTQDEQQLLGSAQSKHRDEAAALPVDDVVDGVAEAGLPLLPLLMNVGSIRGLLGEQTTITKHITKTR